MNIIILIATAALIVAGSSFAVRRFRHAQGVFDHIVDGIDNSRGPAPELSDRAADAIADLMIDDAKLRGLIKDGDPIVDLGNVGGELEPDTRNRRLRLLPVRDRLIHKSDHYVVRRIGDEVEIHPLGQPRSYWLQGKAADAFELHLWERRADVDHCDYVSSVRCLDSDAEVRAAV